MKTLAKTLQALRETHGYTQEELARIFDISRVTLANIESGKRPVSKDELMQYAHTFDIPVEAIQKGIIQIPEKHVTPGNTMKFKELLLYILYKVGMKPNVGKTVIYKLLYFCDFDYYEKYGKSITGMHYIKLPMGPAPYKFDKILAEMQEKQEILVVDAEYGGYHQQRLIGNKVYQQIFSPAEYDIIDQTLERLSDANASEISEYSHEDAPWRLTKDMNIIEYNLVHQRTLPYSILAHEKIQEESIAMFQANDAFDFLLDEPDLYDDYVK